jgi:threonyl-tRNA synthetase
MPTSTLLAQSKEQVVITLPDKSVKKFDKPITAMQLAADIGANLAKATVGAIINGKTVDASTVITGNSTVSLITANSKEGLEIIRHSTAHLLAMATQQLYPGAQVTIGPVIENGFYYDFAYERPFTPEDLTKIELKMKELAKQSLPITRNVITKEEAIDKFTKLGEHYKVLIIKDLPDNEEISVYKQGDWMDLCRGPHVPSTKNLKVFKLERVAGAYWRGDSKNQMLSRIYGTAWANKDDLKQYLKIKEEEAKRDHRKLAKTLDLFHFQQESPGMVFWHPNGWTIYQQIKKYMRKVLDKAGYLEVNTPQIVDVSLWEKSGHWDKYDENMFTVTSEHREMAVKPMNCPCHVQIFNQGIKSYRDLPLRLAEFGSCHRNEASGALHGLARVRGFVQDDAHIFVEESQIQQEVSAFIDLLHKVYADFGFNSEKLIYKLSTRPEKRVGSEEIWDKAEEALAKSLNDKQLDWQKCPGEGAFYGPKLEFTLKDCIGREWQCGTIQVDFSMPQRLNAEYIGRDGEKHFPVMLHRAILGSFERFIAILIEHYAGELPLWLAPTQVVVMNISDNSEAWTHKVYSELQNQGIRTKIDVRNEKIGFKIREHTLLKVPYMVIIGDKEAQQKVITLRLKSGESQGSMSIQNLCDMLQSESNMVL